MYIVFFFICFIISLTIYIYMLCSCIFSIREENPIIFSQAVIIKVIVTSHMML